MVQACVHLYASKTRAMHVLSASKLIPQSIHNAFNSSVNPGFLGAFEYNGRRGMGDPPGIAFPFWELSRQSDLIRMV
jgi:hypothetical protein